MKKMLKGNYFKHDSLKNELIKKKNKKEKYLQNTLLSNKMDLVMHTTEPESLLMIDYFKKTIKKASKNKSLIKCFDDINSFCIIDAKFGVALIFFMKQYAMLTIDVNNNKDQNKLNKINSEHGKLLETFNLGLFYCRPDHLCTHLFTVFNAHQFIACVQPFKNLLNNSKINSAFNINLSLNKLILCLNWNYNVECDGDCGLYHICCWCFSHNHGRLKCPLAKDKINIISKQKWSSKSRSYNNNNYNNRYHNNRYNNNRYNNNRHRNNNSRDSNNNNHNNNNNRR